MMLSDWQIKEFADKGMITPFVNHQVREGNISFGLSSAGYDMRLGTKFLLCMPTGGILDPKNPNDGCWFSVERNDYIDIPPHTFVLAYSVERWALPRNVCMTVLGKSTYARCGLVVNVTPGEPGWVGNLTLELNNNAPLPIRVYVNEGIAQAQFHLLLDPVTAYNDRAGKYMNQSTEPVRSIV